MLAQFFEKMLLFTGTHIYIFIHDKISLALFVNVYMCDGVLV